MPDALSALSMLAPLPSLPTAGGGDANALADASGGFADVLASVFAPAGAAPVQFAPAQTRTGAVEGEAAASGRSTPKAGHGMIDAGIQPPSPAHGRATPTVAPAISPSAEAASAAATPADASADPAPLDAETDAVAPIAGAVATPDTEAAESTEAQGRNASATAAGAKLPEALALAGMTPTSPARRATTDRVRTEVQPNTPGAQTDTTSEEAALPTPAPDPAAGPVDAATVNKDAAAVGTPAAAEDAAEKASGPEASAPSAPAAGETAARETSEAVRTAGPASPIAARAGAETTAALAAQIVKKLDGQNTRFDVLLTPEGLGRVDVTVHIGRDGAVSAAFAFDQPQAASQLGARADELRQALQQAGFEVGRDALSFSNGDRSGGDGRAWQDRAPQRGAFAALFDDGEAQPAALSASPRYGRSLRLGVDLKV